MYKYEYQNYELLQIVAYESHVQKRFKLDSLTMCSVTFTRRSIYLSFQRMEDDDDEAS